MSGVRSESLWPQGRGFNFMNLPLNPAAVAKAAIERGELRVGEAPNAVDEAFAEMGRKCREADLKMIDEILLSALKTPQEAGIAKPAPKVDGRTKAVRRNKPHPSGNKKYVISKAQFRAERPHLYL